LNDRSAAAWALEHSAAVQHDVLNWQQLMQMQELQALLKQQESRARCSTL
jgi:hypothetical protein